MTSSFAALFILLHLGHNLGDYLLQTDKLAYGKAAPGAQGLRYALIHGAHLTFAQAWWVALGAALLPLDLTVTGVAVAIAVNVGTHVLIDWNRHGPRWWCRISGSTEFYEQSEPTVERHQHTHGASLVDQALHFQIIGLTALLAVLLARL